jgi:nucleotide-binding universal stress UspA family protein
VVKKIVVGTDGSDTANHAVASAIELAGLSNAELEVVSAYAPGPESRLKAESGASPDDVAHTVGPREDVELILGNAVAAAKKAKVKVTSHPVEGDPAEALLDVAEKHGADLIVVGNRGMTGATRFFLGSVPNRISHHAPCDVWIVHTSG